MGKKLVLPGAKRGDSYAMDPENVVLVGHDKGWPVDADDPCCDVHRLSYLNEDDPELIALAENMIASKGNIEPVRIVWAKNKKTGEWILTKDDENVVKCSAGRRRTAAMRLANKMLKKAGQPPMLLRVMPPDGGGEFTTTNNEKALELFGLVVSENRFRVDDPPSVTAKQVARYVQMRGGNPAQPSTEDLKDAARYFGKDVSTIRNHLEIDNLQPEVKHLVDAKALPQNVARQLKDLPREQQVHEATKAAATKKAGGKGLLAQTRLAKNKATGKATGDAHEGFTRGEMKRMAKQMSDEDKIKIESDLEPGELVLLVLQILLGDKGPERIKGFTAYANAARPKSTSDQAAE